MEAEVMSLDAPRGGHQAILPQGLILEIASAAGLELQGRGDKRALRCPFHEDHRPSAFLRLSRNLFSCSVCGSFSAKRFAEALNIPWPPSSTLLSFQGRAHSEAPVRMFSPSRARAVWEAALARSRSDKEEHLAADALVYRYLAGRGIAQAWELSAYGILSEGMDIDESVAWWPRLGYRLIVPLYGPTGEIENIQARNIGPRTPKVMNPPGSKVSGTMFASSSGVDLLQGDRRGDAVLFGEGLTDFLALTISADLPVLSAPGVGGAEKAIGPWARGLKVRIALDCDGAGEAKVAAVAQAISQAGGSPFRLRWSCGAKDACDALALLGFDEFSANLAAPLRRP